MAMLQSEHCLARKRSKRIWQKKENALNASIVKEIGGQTGVGIVLEREPM